MFYQKLFDRNIFDENDRKQKYTVVGFLPTSPIVHINYYD